MISSGTRRLYSSAVEKKIRAHSLPAMKFCGTDFAGVVFDMDGLLLDTERLSMRAWQAGARDFGLDVPDALFLEMIGHREADCIAILEKTFGAQIPGKAVAEACRRHYQEILAGGVPLMRGAKDLVEFLAGNDIPLAVATSTHREIARAKLEKAGLLKFFKNVTGGDEVKRGKPAPDIYLAACAALNLPPEKCIAFEDSSPGALSAAGAGLRDKCRAPVFRASLRRRR